MGHDRIIALWNVMECIGLFIGDALHGDGEFVGWGFMGHFRGYEVKYDI